MIGSLEEAALSNHALVPRILITRCCGHKPHGVASGACGPIRQLEAYPRFERNRPIDIRGRRGTKNALSTLSRPKCQLPNIEVAFRPTRFANRRSNISNYRHPTSREVFTKNDLRV